MVAALRGTPYDTGLDLKKLMWYCTPHFAKLREKYLAKRSVRPKMLGVDAKHII
jgi:oxaloacetate decarboxylase alpha subunit